MHTWIEWGILLMPCTVDVNHFGAPRYWCLPSCVCGAIGPSIAMSGTGSGVCPITRGVWKA